jgi:hypothetical protein
MLASPATTLFETHRAGPLWLDTGAKPPCILQHYN